METTRSFAIYWGFITVGTYLPALTSKAFFTSLLEVKEKADFVILSGLISLLAGAISLGFVHDWEWSLTGVITFIGWVNVLKGMGRFFEVNRATTAVKKVSDRSVMVYVYMAASLGLGLYLLYRGFWG